MFVIFGGEYWLIIFWTTLEYYELVYWPSNNHTIHTIIVCRLLPQRVEQETVVVS